MNYLALLAVLSLSGSCLGKCAFITEEELKCMIGQIDKDHIDEYFLKCCEGMKAGTENSKKNCLINMTKPAFETCFEDDKEREDVIKHWKEITEVEEIKKMFENLKPLLEEGDCHTYKKEFVAQLNHFCSSPPSECLGFLCTYWIKKYTH